MSNPFVSWWRSNQFRAALKQNNERKATQILLEIENSGAKLSWLERLFRKKLESEESSSFYQRELASVSARLHTALPREEELEGQISPNIHLESLLVSDTEFVQFIHHSFKFNKLDEYRLQCTGIDKRVFDDFEASLAQFLQTELDKISKAALTSELERAIRDIEGLKQGLDPQYSFKLSPYVYFMTYFLDNVYCAYIAWFLIYEAGLIPQNLKILDIAAGPGTVAYGLALLLQSNSGFFPLPQMHISYYSLEKQYLLQFRGLQFWRQYIDPKHIATNAYFRFDTSDIFDYKIHSKKLPESFFNFIVISHCFFYETQKRNDSYIVYKNIIQDSLAVGGYVLLIVQGMKLFNAYDVPLDDMSQEQIVIREFLEELGLQLEWYKYLTSTGERVPMNGAEFGKFARENLPEQKYMSPLKRQYLGQQFDSNYVLDDYVILAKRQGATDSLDPLSLSE
ncbi:MAG: photosystem II assembly protein [Coleofasciculus sp. S288]|nr:photosystem II assembly protein [Coleofasciculus sp. S288]